MGMVFHSALRLFIPGLALVTKLGDRELVKTPVNLRVILRNTGPRGPHASHGPGVHHSCALEKDLLSLSGMSNLWPESFDHL